MDKRLNVTGRLFLVALGVLGLLTFSCQRSPTPDSNGTDSDARSPLSSPIVTAEPTTRTFTKEVPWIGVVESRHSIELTALVPGRVDSIDVQDEMPIETDATVMTLGGPEVEAQRAPLQANIDSLKSELGLADRLAKHLAELHGEKLSTNEQYTAAEQKRIEIQSQLEDAQLALSSFEKETQIVGSTSGVFTDRRVSVGQSVQAGKVVGAVIDPEHLRIVATVHTDDGSVLQDKDASVRLSADKHLTAVVERVLPQSSKNGQARVWIEGPAVDAELRPGQSVGGTIVVNTAPDALSVPDSAIVYDSDERPYVFVANGNGYERRDVDVGQTQDGWVEIRSGVKASESIATQGAYELFYRDFNERYKVQD